MVVRVIEIFSVAGCWQSQEWHSEIVSHQFHLGAPIFLWRKEGFIEGPISFLRNVTDFI
jgi:hypothetical protein